MVIINLDLSGVRGGQKTIRKQVRVQAEREVMPTDDQVNSTVLRSASLPLSHLKTI